MNEFISKVFLPSITLIAIVVFPSTLFATVKNNSSNQSESSSAMFRTQMGCLSCHQSQSMQPETPTKQATKTSR